MWCNFVKVNITTKLILRISMDSYINDYCAFLHIGLIHELWFANCNHQNICLSGNFLHILCFGVAYGYCTVFSILKSVFIGKRQLMKKQSMQLNSLKC